MKILLCSHGSLASGLKSSLSVITGMEENIFAMDFYLPDSPETEPALKEYFDNTPESELVFVFVDFLGGSVFQKLIRYIHRKNTYIFAGMSFPLVIQFVLFDKEFITEKTIFEFVEEARKQSVYVNDVIESFQVDDAIEE